MSKIKFGIKSKITVLSLTVIAIVACVFGIGAVKNNGYHADTKSVNSEIEKTMSVLTADNTIVERTIANCTFTGASSHLVVATGTEYTLDNCTFDGTTGRAIEVYGGTLNLTNCKIVNGNSSENGVAIYSNAGNINITDTEISNNTLSAGYGAALYVDGAVTVNLMGKTIITDNQITDTTATTNGGSAIYIKGTSVEAKATLNIGTVTEDGESDVAFTGTISQNTVANGNGTINAASNTIINLNSGTLGKTTLDDIEYNSNEVNGDGEVFYIGATSTLYIKNNASLKGMIATESPMIIGGNIFYEGNSVDVANYIYTVKSK